MLTWRVIDHINTRRETFSEIWSGRRVSNSRPQPWQGCALPTELLPRGVTTDTTNCEEPSGAGEESRTLDLNLGKVALYQLSYSRLGVQHAAIKLWSGRRVSNSRPQPWQGCALPTELLPHGVLLLYHYRYRYDVLQLELEREKSLELSTSTLARLRSTN
jgi:hypothetical protein